MPNKFAISDIHGCPQTFDALLDQIAFSKADSLYLLGDYVDKGSDSKGVLDKVLELKNEGYDVQCLLGNHEEMLLDSLKNLSGSLYNKCFNSFGVTHAKDIPQTYYDLIDTFKHYFIVDNYIMVHAGLNFNNHNPLDDKEAMLWIRDWHPTIDHTWLDGRIIVHGHTPMKKGTIIKSFAVMESNGWLDIDAGCSMGYNEGLGNLSAFDLSNGALFFEPFRAED